MCGIIGITNCPDVIYSLLDGLEQVQHRGEDTAGYATWYSGDKFNVVKGRGLAREVAGRCPDIGYRLAGNFGIAHVRYPTAGDNPTKVDADRRVYDAQPFHTESPIPIVLSHNGNITNPDELRAMFEDSQIPVRSGCDTELIMRDFQRILKENKYYKHLSDDGLDREFIFDTTAQVMEDVQGAYTVCMMINDGKASGPKMIAFSDRHGIRPGVYGKHEGSYMVASETVALDVLGFEFLGDINPGEAIIFDGDDLTPKQLVKGESRPCMFEWIYFSDPSSKRLGIEVYGVRKRMGELLARKFRNLGLEADIVTKSPDSGAGYNHGCADALGIPVTDGFAKNRYVGRTFLASNNAARQRMNKKKNRPIRSQLEGKNLIITDDSSIRGNASRNIVKLAREAGAEEVHLAIGCVPTHRCFYGIAMTDKKEFIGSGKSPNELADALGADTIVFGTADDVAEAIGIPKEKLCTACLDGNYPTDISNSSYNYESGHSL